jgi:hypothetical protein
MNEEQTKQVIDTVNSSAVLLQEVNSEVKRLNTAVLGDDVAGIQGLATRVEAVEKKSEKHGIFMIKALTVWGVICGAVVVFKDKLFG